MRKTVLIMLRWISLPLAAFVVIATAMSAIQLADRYAHMMHADALILESELRRAGSRGIGAEFELYIRYSGDGGRQVESSMTAMGDTFRSLRPGRRISVWKNIWIACCIASFGSHARRRSRC